VGCGDLDRREGTVIEVGLDAGQRRNQPLVADGKAHAPAGHGKGLRHRGELDRDIDRAGHFQYGRRRGVFEVDFRIGEVRKHDQLMLLGKGDDVLVEIEAGDPGCGVGRIIDDQRDRLRDRMAHRPLERREEGFVRLDRDRADDAAGHQEAEGMDRIGRVGAEHHVARRCDRLGHVGKALLRAERRNDLGVGVELDVEAAGIIGRLGPTQAGNALGRGIAMGARVLDHFAELVDDRLRRRQIGISHAEVDDVRASGSRARLQTIDLFENVWRQTPDLVKFFHLQPLEPHGHDRGRRVRFAW